MNNYDPVEEECPGRSRAWSTRWRGQPHPVFKRHPPCRLCGGDLGCERCSGIITELFCFKCRDWGSIQAFEFHGTLYNKKQRDAAAKLMGSSVVQGMAQTRSWKEEA